MAKKFEIRNSTVEFQIFQIEGKEDGVQVVYRDESIWCTQKAMAQLFDCSTDNIGLHLKNIYDTGELLQEATTEKFSVVQTEDERQVHRISNSIMPTVLLSRSLKKHLIIQDRLFQSDFNRFNDNVLSLDSE